MTKHFFDIGANVGQTFDWLATQPNNYKDHVFWLFEPSPRHFAALMAKCEKQANKGYQIRLCPFGLGGSNGAHKFYTKDDAQGDSFASWTKSDHVPKNIARRYEICGATIAITDFILSHTKTGDEIVLDIDAEGAEYEILWDLSGLPSAQIRVRRIMVEFHHIRGKGMDCVRQKKMLCDTFYNLGLQLEVRGFVP